MITKNFVIQQLKEQHFAPTTIEYINSGSNHHVFSVDTEEKGSLIIKFPKYRQTELEFDQGNVDTLFGGRLSFERERYLLKTIRNLGTPTPTVHGIYPSTQGKYIVVAKCPGISHRDYMKLHHHSQDLFNNSMHELGKSLARLHSKEFDSFGDLLDKGVIYPPNITNFVDRYKEVHNRIIDRCINKNCLSKQELHKTIVFFDKKFEDYRPLLDKTIRPARLVITDMHDDNFFVNEKGIPTGFFDVESSQAAPAEFEFYSLRFFLFNRYDIQTMQTSEAAFWKGYGLKELDEKTDLLIDFFSGCRLLEIFQSYWGYRDGIRDSWGEDIKKIFLDYIENNSIDYINLGSVWRERDNQPEFASIQYHY